MVQEQIQGTIKRWNDDKGFGFLKSDKHSKDIFCHISAFKNLPKGLRPVVGDTIFFQVKDTEKGLQATNAMYSKANNYTSEPIRKSQSNYQKNYKKSSQYHQKEEISIFSLLTTVLAILAILAIGYYIYQGLHERFSPKANYAPSKNQVPSQPAIQTNTNPHNFTCDGREHCSQMSSYDEAKYFTDNCPNTKMDGDHDGIPCESQF